MKIAIPLLKEKPIYFCTYFSTEFNKSEKLTLLNYVRKCKFEVFSDTISCQDYASFAPPSLSKSLSGDHHLETVSRH